MERRLMWPFTPLVELARTRMASRRFPDGLPWHEPPDEARDALAMAALGFAIGSLGYGEAESEGNNRGPFIRTICAPAGDGHAWCAAFAGWCYEQAANRLGYVLPFRRSLSAKALGRNVAGAGRRFVDASLAKPGDLMILDRGPAGSWMGHVAIVEDVELGICHTIEGNSGPKVARRVRTTRGDDRFSFFASVRR